MGITLKKYEPLPNLTVQGNNYQAPNVSLAPVQAPAQNIQVPNYGPQPTNNWGSAPAPPPSNPIVSNFNGIVQDFLHPSKIYNPITQGPGANLIKLGAAKLTNNPTAATNAQAGLKKAVKKANANFINSALSGGFTEGGIKEKPVVTAIPHENPIDTFVSQTQKMPALQSTGDFNKDLETNALRLKGSHSANTELGKQLIDQGMKANPSDMEAVYHHLEDPTTPLTPTQQAIHDQVVQPLNEGATSAYNALRGTNLESEGHVPRIALDKNSRIEQYITGDSSTPSENVLKKSLAATKGRTMKSLTDENGARMTVSIKTAKDELGKSQGKRVTAFVDGRPTDLGPLKLEKPDGTPVNSTAQNQLNGKVFVQDIKNNAGKVIGQHKFTIGEATTKEIEGNSNVRYLKNPVVSTAVANVNARNAVNANNFLNWMKLQPGAEDHIMPSQGAGKPPNDWRPVDSPYFAGYHFDPKTADVLDNYFGKEARTNNAVLKGYQGATNIAVQSIVTNPTVHGLNLYTQALIESGKIPLGKGPITSHIPSGPIGMARFIASRYRITDENYYQARNQEMLREGGHVPPYGKNQQTVFSKAFNKLNLPEVNKFNSRAMSSIDGRARTALYDANVRAGVDPTKAIKDIDNFMGDQKKVGELAKNTGLFYHWLRTEVKATAHTAVSPGAAVNAAILGLAVLYGANKAWQDITGNKNAHVRVPGELGLINDLYKAPGQIENGQVPTVIGGHVNPLIAGGIDLLAGKNTGTGAPLNTTSDKIKDVASRAFAPAQYGTKVSSGKQSPAEAATNYFGLYTPHVKGTQAAPKISLLNTKDSTPNTNQAYADQTAHFKAVDQAQKSLSGKDLTDYQSYFARNKTPDGKTIQLDPKDALSNARLLVNSDKLRSAIQKVEKASGSHDPMWDLSDSQLKTFLNYKAQIKDSADQINIRNNNPWIFDLEGKQQAFYNSLGPTKSVKSAFSQQHPFPLSNNEYNLMVQARKISDPQAKSQFYQDHPELTDINQRYGNYINQIRANQDAAPLPAPPQANPGVQAIINEYNALPKHDGPKGGNKTRSLWIQAHPDAYAMMTNFYTQSSLYDLVKQAAADQLNGNAAGDQKLLKAAYSLGQYDIVKNPDGTYQIGNSSGGGSSTSSGGYVTIGGKKYYASSSSGGRKYVSRTQARLQNPSAFSVDIDAGGKPHYAAIRKGVSKSKVRPAQLSSKSNIAIKGKPQISLKASNV